MTAAAPAASRQRRENECMETESHVHRRLTLEEMVVCSFSYLSSVSLAVCLSLLTYVIITGANKRDVLSNSCLSIVVVIVTEEVSRHPSLMQTDWCVCTVGACLVFLLFLYMM